MHALPVEGDRGRRRQRVVKARWDEEVPGLFEGRVVDPDEADGLASGVLPQYLGILDRFALPIRDLAQGEERHPRAAAIQHEERTISPPSSRTSRTASGAAPGTLPTRSGLSALPARNRSASPAPWPWDILS